MAVSLREWDSARVFISYETGKEDFQGAKQAIGNMLQTGSHFPNKWNLKLRQCKKSTEFLPYPEKEAINFSQYEISSGF